MPVKYRMPIILSSHAIQRWRERVGRERPAQMQGRLRKAIQAAMRAGMDIEQSVAVINVTEGVRAVVAPSLQGGREVITITSDYRICECGRKVKKGDACERCSIE